MNIVISNSKSQNDISLAVVKSYTYSVDNYNVINVNNNIVSTTTEYDLISTFVDVNLYQSTGYLGLQHSSGVINSYISPYTSLDTSTGNYITYKYNMFDKGLYIPTINIKHKIVNNLIVTSTVLEPSKLYGTYDLTDYKNRIITSSFNITVASGDAYVYYDPIQCKLNIKVEDPAITQATSVAVTLEFDSLLLNDKSVYDDDVIYLWIEEQNLNNLGLNYTGSDYKVFYLAVYSKYNNYIGKLTSIKSTYKDSEYYSFATSLNQTSYVDSTINPTKNFVFYPSLFLNTSVNYYIPETVSIAHSNIFNAQYVVDSILLNATDSTVNLFVYSDKLPEAGTLADKNLFYDEAYVITTIDFYGKYNSKYGYSIDLSKYNIESCEIMDLDTMMTYSTYYDYYSYYIPINKLIIDQSHSFKVTLKIRQPHGYIKKAEIKLSDNTTITNFNLSLGILLKYYNVAIYDNNGSIDTYLIENNNLSIFKIGIDPAMFNINGNPVGYLTYLSPTLQYDISDIRNFYYDDTKTSGWGVEPIDGILNPVDKYSIVKISSDLINYVKSLMLPETEEWQLITDEVQLNSTIAQYIKDSIEKYKEFYRKIYYYDTYVIDLPYDINYEIKHEYNRLVFKIKLELKYQKLYFYEPSLINGTLNGIYSQVGQIKSEMGAAKIDSISSSIDIVVFPTTSGSSNLYQLNLKTYYIDNIYEETSAIHSISIPIEFDEEYGGPNCTVVENITYYDMLESLNRNDKVTGYVDNGDGTCTVTVENGGYGDTSYGII